MIDALIAGKLYGKPTTRKGKSGKPFVACKVRAATGENETLFVNAIAFDEQVVAALLALDDGDSVSLTGPITPKVWTPPNGGEPRASLDMIVHGILTAYHARRKRQAVACDSG
jgi:single-stranded DNA-binding protein